MVRTPSRHSTSGDHGDQSLRTPSSSTLEQIQNDEVISEFLSEKLSATEFASKALSSGSALASSNRLSHGIHLLQRQLYSEVTARHSELLGQLGSLRDTESVLVVVRAGVDSLNASVARVRSEIGEPYRQMKTKTRQLSALHSTIELLRSLIRFLKLVRKLRDSLPSKEEGVGQGQRQQPLLNPLELAKAGQLFHEATALRAEVPELGGLAAVREEEPWLQAAGKEIRTEALSRLEKGLDAMNQAEVGSVLQVFFNMGELRSTVESVIAKYKVQASRAIAAALDPKALSALSSSSSSSASSSHAPGSVSRAGGAPLLSTSSSSRPFKDAVLSHLALLLQRLHSLLLSAWQLQRVLAKKRDPLTHVVFLDEVAGKPGDSTPVAKLFEAVARALSTHLRSSALSSSSFLHESLVSSFPSLLSLFDAMLDKLSKDTETPKDTAAAGVRGGGGGGGGGTGGGVVGEEERREMRGALEPFQSAFLARSLSRLTDAVNSLLPAGSRENFQLPDRAAAQRLATRIEAEIESVRVPSSLTTGGPTATPNSGRSSSGGGAHSGAAAPAAPAFHPRLLLLLLKGIDKTLQLLAERCEYQLATGPESRQVDSSATAAQQKNMALCLFLGEVHSRVARLLDPVGPVVYPEAVAAAAAAAATVAEEDEGTSGPRDSVAVAGGRQQQGGGGLVVILPGLAGLSSVQAVTVQSVAPMFKSMSERLESLLLRIHSADFSSEDATSLMPDMEDAPSSSASYLKPVVQSLVRFRTEFLSHLSSSLTPQASGAGSGAAAISVDPTIAALTQGLASRTLLFFVRHASLLRPLSEPGKLKLARDMSEIEFAVSQNVFPVEKLGQPYKALRAFRPLLFLDTHQVAGSPMLKDLPPSIILHHLFSRAPPELESPFSRIQLSPAKYSLWLDQHNETDAWRAVKASLDAYAAKVQARGDKEFAAVYPVILSLGQQLMEQQQGEGG